MKKIEERAKQWATDYPKTPDATYTNNDIEAIAENSFIQGATEQKAIDIEKACDWFKKWCKDSKYYTMEESIDMLRKAMEE